jgi:hypothetical protein
MARDENVKELRASSASQGNIGIVEPKLTFRRDWVDRTHDLDPSEWGTFDCQTNSEFHNDDDPCSRPRNRRWPNRLNRPIGVLRCKEEVGGLDRSIDHLFLRKNSEIQ